MANGMPYFSSNSLHIALIEHSSIVEEAHTDINRQHNLIDVIFLVIRSTITRPKSANASKLKAGKN
ncbi:transposase [Xenorhabdus mauleonii]|uniref:Transposase n=1 Tax=Xenorhabdus mauleonii TaxID=351675 RepID=A0A1I3HQ23_9GAMM|nr:hypothetical protein [Xenorhabdus mauleonii]PHM40312.1 transposase [Xenorhabdus mauleonii]SFI37878.1 hypothetical protein SAMN05421680_10125 [Xenorhabdus mauleonii]